MNAEHLEKLIGPSGNTSLPGNIPSPLAPLCWCFDLYAPADDSTSVAHSTRMQLETLLSHLPLFRHLVDRNIRLNTPASTAYIAARRNSRPKQPRWKRWLRITRRGDEASSQETDDEIVPPPIDTPPDPWGTHPNETCWAAVHESAFLPCTEPEWAATES